LPIVASEHEIACQQQEDTGEEGVADRECGLPGYVVLQPIKPMA
jgi:hypothetical protein